MSIHDLVIFDRIRAQGNASVSGAGDSERNFLSSTPSQKQSRQQLDKRYLSIRKTISSNAERSSLRNENSNNSLFDGVEADNSLAAVFASSCISTEKQGELLIKVSVKFFFVIVKKCKTITRCALYSKKISKNTVISFTGVSRTVYLSARFHYSGSKI